MSYDQLMKLVRGQAHLSLRHAADLTRVLGGPVLTTTYQQLLKQRDSRP